VVKHCPSVHETPNANECKVAGEPMCSEAGIPFRIESALNLETSYASTRVHTRRSVRSSNMFPT